MQMELFLESFWKMIPLTMQVLKEGVTNQALYSEIKINLEYHIKMIEEMEQPDIMHKMQLESYKNRTMNSSSDSIDNWISKTADGYEKM